MATRELEIKASNTTMAWANEVLGLTFTEIGSLIGVDRRTVYRWRQREHVPSPTARRRIEELRELRFLLDSVFEDERAALEWLHTSVPMLRGRTPMSLLRAGDIEAVLGVLAGFESGAFI